jgi:tetratricopeptide (TPR) repeat protein
MSKSGRELDALAKFDDAAGQFRSLRLWSEMGRTLLAKANVLIGRGMYHKSHEAYRRAAYLLRGKPFHGDALLGAAITTVAVGGPDAAVLRLYRIIGDDRLDTLVRAKASSNLAMTLRQLGRYKEAVQEVNAALVSRAMLPTRLVAAMLAESALCYVRMGDAESARRVLREYKAIPGVKDDQDIAAMRILARVLGDAPPNELVSKAVADEHGYRMSEALRILQEFPLRTRV